MFVLFFYNLATKGFKKLAYFLTFFVSFDSYNWNIFYVCFASLNEVIKASCLFCRMLVESLFSTIIRGIVIFNSSVEILNRASYVRDVEVWIFCCCFFPILAMKRLIAGGRHRLYYNIQSKSHSFIRLLFFCDLISVFTIFRYYFLLSFFYFVKKVSFWFCVSKLFFFLLSCVVRLTQSLYCGQKLGYFRIHYSLFIWIRWLFAIHYTTLHYTAHTFIINYILNRTDLTCFNGRGFQRSFSGTNKS